MKPINQPTTSTAGCLNPSEPSATRPPRRPWLLIALLLVITAMPSVRAATNAVPKPLLPHATEWRMNDYCRQRQIGHRPFYFAAQGAWSYAGDSYRAMRSLGLDRHVLPGSYSISVFDPTNQRSAADERLVQLYLTNQWPFMSNEGHASRENARPVTPAAVASAQGLWLGDGHTEYNYRFDFLLPVVRDVPTTWMPASEAFRIAYTRQHAIPILERELPFFRDTKHRWTHAEYYRLSEIQQNFIFQEIGVSNAMPWCMGELGFYYLASQPGCRAVGDKNLTYLTRARCRGAMRQFGGDKCWVLYQPHEPMSLLSSHFQHSRLIEQGYPYSHARIFLYEPYLAGVNYTLNEAFPGSLMLDIEDDGHYERSPLGHLFREVTDFIARHPERGIPYAPAALLADWERTAPGNTGTSYGTYLSFDDADQMNYGLLNLLFPETPEGGYYSYFRTAPYGDIFDQIKPNVPGRGVDPRALENYRLLVAMGGLSIDADLAAKLQDHVTRGGCLVVNVMEISPALSAEFLGVDCTDEESEAGASVCACCGQRFEEPVFPVRTIRPREGTEVLATTGDARPLITRRQVGQGSVIVVAAKHLIARDAEKTVPGNWMKKDLIRLTGHFMDHLVSGLLPVDVIIPEPQRRSIGYSVARKGDGWTITLVNYSYDRRPVEIVKYGTAAIDAACPPAETPVRLVCRVPVTDALEWFENREVERKVEDGQTVIDTVIASGGMQVIEIQPAPIFLAPVEEPVNYALHAPVTATSEAKGHAARCLVDGDTRRNSGWWSDERVRGRVYKTPQSATIDLRQVRMIDRVEVLFTYDQRDRLAKYYIPRYSRYHVDASLDGETWETIFDERANMKPNVGWPQERWFEPRKARYVRLTVLHDSMHQGAMVAELKVMGAERKTVEQPRLSFRPPWEVQYPDHVRDVAAKDTLFLIKHPPAQPPKLGWMPDGRQWTDLNGTVKLLTSIDREGAAFQQSLYAEAPSELVFAIPEGYTTFAAVAGLGADRTDDAVVFRVLVDGVEKFKSRLYRLGQPLLPVVVDLNGGRELKLVVDDPAGNISAYAWWGEARLLRARQPREADNNEENPAP